MCPSSENSDAEVLEKHAALWIVCDLAALALMCYQSNLWQGAQDTLTTLGFGNVHLWISVLSALALTAVVCVVQKLPRRWHVAFLLLLPMTALIWNRPTLYFYWDEWHVIDRFLHSGFQTALTSHNEHYIPLFFFFYFLELLIFGDHYFLFLVVSFALHLITALLLCRFLKLLLAPMQIPSVVYLVMSLLFLTNSLHGEVMGWAFVQCVILCQIASLVALIACLEYLAQGKIRYLIYAGLASSAAPLFFASGFGLSLQVSAVVLFAGVVGKGFTSGRWKRSAVVLGITIPAQVISFLLYRCHQGGTGHGIESANPFSNLEALWKYVFVGTQFGTVLRGSGAAPILEFDAKRDALPMIASILPSGTEPEMVYAYLGFALSLVLLVAYCVDRPKRMTWCSLWLLGQILISIALFLPALGRWQAGLGQALSLRYQYAASVGLMVMLLPLVIWLSTKSSTKSSLIKSRIACICLCAYFTIHLFVGPGYQYFSKKGEANLNYIVALHQWGQSKFQQESKRRLQERPENLQKKPKIPETLTPAKRTREIYGMLHWMNPKEYPEPVGNTFR